MIPRPGKTHTRSANKAPEATEEQRNICQTVAYTQRKRAILTYRKLRVSSYFRRINSNQTKDDVRLQYGKKWKLAVLTLQATVVHSEEGEQFIETITLKRNGDERLRNTN